MTKAQYSATKPQYSVLTRPDWLLFDLDFGYWLLGKTITWWRQYLHPDHKPTITRVKIVPRRSIHTWKERSELNQLFWDGLNGR